MYIKKRVLLLIVVLASVLYVHAQAYPFECKKMGTEGYWECKLKEVINDSNKNSYGIIVTGARGRTVILSFVICDLDNGGFYNIEKGKRGVLKLYLSNGEILTTSSAGGELWINLGAHSLSSNKVTIPVRDQGNYAMRQLRNYNITKIVVEGKEFTTPRFRSAATIDAMCKSLISNTGDQGQYGSRASSTTPSTTQGSAPSNIPVSASISNISVSHDQMIKGEKGMTINMKLNVNGMKGKKLGVTAYFYDENGTALNDLNQKYWTTDKKVCSVTNPSATYDNSVWDSYKISIPYRELHMSGVGFKTVKFKIIVWNKEVNPSKNLYTTALIATTFFNDPNFLIVNGSANESTVSFSSKGERKKVTVETNDASYDTWGVPSWCKLENKTANSFEIVCSPNVSSESRKDYMKVKAAGKELIINLSQEKLSGPAAVINRTWVEHNVRNGLAKGMKIHINLEVYGMQGRNVSFGAFFYQGDNSTMLIDGYGRPISYQGFQRVNYQTTTFSDWWLFIPYSYIMSAINRGINCSFNIEIKDEYNRLLTYYQNVQFTLQ